jgi:uncharacterized protein (DUF1800 family)
MSANKYKRRDFFNKVLNRDEREMEEDILFKKYSRKTSSGRLYTPYENFIEKIDHPAENGASDQAETAERVGSITSGLTAYAGAWTERHVIHLLKRTGFGNKKTDIETFAAMTMSAAVDAITTINANPALPSHTPLNYNQATVVDPVIPLGGDWTSNNLTYSTATSLNDRSVNNYRLSSHLCWNWGLWLNDGPTIREKMVGFWYHFIPVNYNAINSAVNNSATIFNDYIKLLRDNALGNFKTLIKLIAKSPAMLIYLSNHYSTAAAPNENFARELMELFMLGKEPTQNYTELDVQSGAKVLSGWRVASFTNPYPFVVNFYSNYHNQSEKTFSSNFNNNVIANQAGASGANEFNAYFDMLFLHQSTTIAKYICRRLYRYFVYYDIDASVETNVIVPLAAALISNNWNMLPVVRLLLKSEHFFDMANRGVMIKSPIDMIAGIINTLKVNTTAPSGATQILDQYKIWENLNNNARYNMEQGQGLVPTVSGWKAYYQVPTFYQNWINANTIQKRSAYLTSLVSGYTVSGTAIKIDGIAFIQQFPLQDAQSPGTVVDIFVRYLLSLDLPQTYKNELKVQNLLSGQVTDNYWTAAWNNFINNPTSTAYRTTVNNKLKALITAIIQLAEFQLM